MPKTKLATLLLLGTALLSLSLLTLVTPLNAARAQQPSPSVPTVTGTPSAPLATVSSDNPQINVRSGPGLDYPEIGILLARQTVPVLGRTPGGDWVQVLYPGAPGNVAWIYTYNLIIPPNSGIPILPPPPTPTPRITPTIDPTFAAQFVIELPPTRQPTFTAPPPLVIPTYAAITSTNTGGIPAGLPIAILLVVGALGLLFSLLTQR